jgi:hypothetical protein
LPPPSARGPPRRGGRATSSLGLRRIPELTFPATLADQEAGCTRLRSFQPRGRGASGLIEAAAALAGRRKLVVLISDFHMPAEDVTAIFESLRGHDTVPLHLVDSAEAAVLPSWGILPLTDLETGRRRLVALRPSLKAAWEKSREEREQHLRNIATRFARSRSASWTAPIGTGSARI